MLSKTKPSHFLSFLILFLFLFPKGGIKIGAVPITWGYLLLGIAAMYLLLKKDFLIQKMRLIAFMGTLPFTMYGLATIAIYSYEEIGYVIAFFISFLFLPFCFFVLFGQTFENTSDEYFDQWIKQGILFLSCYGIFLFFFKLIYGKFIEIPLITVNLHDIGLLETTKCINRGGIYKLISTYNNGNLYGVCLLMLTPWYYLVEKRIWPRNLLRLSYLLTLSRTVWVGMFIVETLIQIYQEPSKKWLIIKLSSLCSTTIGSLMFLAYKLGWKYSFFFDLSLGGRLREFIDVHSIFMFPTDAYLNIAEIVYLGIIQTFGVVGLLLFILAMLSPLVLYFAYPMHSHPKTKSIILGIITYLTVAFSDGTILLIPTLALYWFLCSYLLSLKFQKSLIVNI